MSNQNHNPNNIYIGIDSSFTDTAIVGLQDGEVIFEEHITSKPTPKKNKSVKEEDDSYPRLAKYYDDLCHVLRQAHPIGRLVYYGIEVPMGVHAGAGAKADQAFTACILALANLQCNKIVKTFKPTEIKKFATGKGNFPKPAVVKEVYKKWGIDTNNHNSADAYAIARLTEARSE